MEAAVQALLREEKMKQLAAQKTDLEGEAPVTGSPWCEWCGNPAHRLRECPDVPPDWCGLCERSGHEWQECPHRKLKRGGSSLRRGSRYYRNQKFSVEKYTL
ncbi:UNVERIFIED_CONTAM: hypothetical protein FKN15_008906 [Acipenser sinensis]